MRDEKKYPDNLLIINNNLELTFIVTAASICPLTIIISVIDYPEF